MTKPKSVSTPTLIVDDDPDMQQLLCAILQPRGHLVTVCSNAESAWALCQHHLYNLIVLDYMLPGMDGLELCRQIRTLNHGDRSVIIIFTGWDQSEDLQAVLDAGADDYLAKSNDLALLEVRLAIAERQAEALTQRKQAEADLAAARQYELDIGAKIQQSLLLNQPLQNIPGLDIAALTRPSQQIDGDFYDFIRYENLFDVMIGDVMGKGVPAALLGAAIKAQFLRSLNQLLISSQSLSMPSPQEIMMKIQHDMSSYLIELESFSTIFYMRFDLKGQQLSFVDCGHTEMIYVEAQSGNYHLLKGNNMPLGFSENEEYEQISIPFKVGDMFICYSDGLTETQNHTGEFFGEKCLAECIQQHCHLTSDALLHTIMSAHQRFSQGIQPKDDLTCIIIKIEPSELTPNWHANTSIQSDLSQLETVREFVRETCGNDLPFIIPQESIHELQLAVTEVISNIIHHACQGPSDTEIQIEVNIFSRKITVSLFYSGQMFEPDIIELPDIAEYPEGGFGLYIIEQCVNKVEYIYHKYDKNKIYLEKCF